MVVVIINFETGYIVTIVQYYRTRY